MCRLDGYKMPQYRYKLARKTINTLYKIKRNLPQLYEADDLISKKLGFGNIFIKREESQDALEDTIKRMRDVLNSPGRFK